MNVKRCPRCEQIKPLDEFHRHRTRKDGRTVYCRQCRQVLYREKQEYIRARSKEYRRKNRDRINESQRKRHNRHRDERNTKRRKRYSQHKDEINAKRREYYTENKQHIQAARREYYANDLEYRLKCVERVKEYQQSPVGIEQKRIWREINREKINAHNRKRYANDLEYRAKALAHGARRVALKKGAQSAELIDRQFIIERDDVTCYICGNGSLDDSEIHLDHIIPLSKGGSHTSENLKVACVSCNCKKQDKTLDEVYQFIEEGLW